VILIPVKNLRNAKQRLAPVLDQVSRTQLAQAMLTDVLETVSALPHRPPVSLVTNDPFAVALARTYNFDVIPDAANESETAAIEEATRLCEQRGSHFTLVLPGDIPLVTVAELAQIFKVAPAQGSVLVPASDNRGTNAALRNPPSLFPLRFGNDSFAPHLAAANATGKPCKVLSLPGLALDVDTPEDLHALTVAPGRTKSQAIVRQWNLSLFKPGAEGSREGHDS